MLYAFDLKFKWLPDTLVKEVNEKVEMLVRQDVASMFAYQRIVPSLAADCANPGRMLMIQFFSESVKEHLVKKICGMSQSEYRSQGWLRWFRTLFTEQSITYRKLIREIDHVNGICLTFAHLRLQVVTVVTVKTFSTMPRTPAAAPRPEQPPRIVSRRSLPGNIPRALLPTTLSTRRPPSEALGAPPREEDDELPDIPSPPYSDIIIMRLALIFYILVFKIIL